MKKRLPLTNAVISAVDVDSDIAQVFNRHLDELTATHLRVLKALAEPTVQIQDFVDDDEEPLNPGDLDA